MTRSSRCWRQGRPCLVLGLMLALPLVVAACRSSPDLASRPPAQADTERTPFVGTIRSVRGNVIFVQEEGGENRRAEIYLSPGTEITTRTSSMLMPIANLRANMRVRVWFSGPVNDKGGLLSASAARMIIDP